MATLNDILTEVDEVKPNQYDDGLKIMWLSNIEYRNVNEVFKTHVLNEGEEMPEFTGYDESSINDDLLAPAPYTDIYKYFLFAMIDLNNGETDRYSNSMIMFNNAWTAWANHYNSEHLPIGCSLKLF